MGQILEHRGKAVATFEATEELSKIVVDGSAVFFSRKTEFGFLHNDFNGPCGRSIYGQDRNTITHQSDSGIIFSTDRIDRKNMLVEHFDSSHQKTGESQFRINEADIIVSNDRQLVDSIEQTVKSLGLDCPETKQAYDELLAAQKACGENNDAMCRDVSGLNSKYNFLKRQCVSQP